ncbi:MAG: M61 family metallopeptidase [Candidatus Riflebacteria bacterium]|nr:M61 family metallopeptidase [Candidatus Riflebacteria bacterium]
MQYTVSAQSPRTHLLEVELIVDEAGPGPVRIAFPVWVPGHYMVEEFAGYVRGERATDGEGKPLPCAKVDKTTWEVRPAKARRVHFRFQTWAYEASTHHSYLDDERLSLNGGTVYPYVEGRLDEPCTVRFQLPADWEGPFSGLEPVAGEPGTFAAENYDQLLDCPVVAGHPFVSRFDVQGVPHYLVVSGKGNAPLTMLTRDLSRLTSTAVSIFGKPPYRHFHYLLDLSLARGGGLEHQNSTHCMLGRFSFHPRSGYVEAVALFAHEFFHTWNVKRLRPSPLGPFDYSREIYTPLLWFAEGVTSYYEMLLLRRSGVVTPREFLDLLGREIQKLSLVPGRRFQTLEMSSFETWIKFYKRGSHSLNSQISYYNKGALVGFLLDMELRETTGNKRTMDHLMRRMYEEYFVRQNRGFTREELEDEASRLAGRSMGRFFDSTLRSTRELELARALGSAGLELVNLDKSAGAAEILPAATSEPISYLGINLQLGRSLVVDNVLDPSPAFDAGFAPGDEILAVNRMRLTPQRMEALLAENAPGTRLVFMIDRSGELREMDVTLGRRPGISVSIRPKAHATDGQKALCKTWMKSDWTKLDRTAPPVVQRDRDRVG